MLEAKSKQYLMIETLVRIVLGIIFLILEYAEPFRRKIHPDELWLYQNPRTQSYVPTYMLWPIICTVPFVIIFVSNVISKIKADGSQSILGLTLCFGINGVITNAVKLIVGRPRPDFYFRCFPDGKGNSQMNCNGNKDDIIEGLKSFPSGHSSFAFASMTFCTLYMCGKLQVFTNRGRGESWRLIISFAPLFGALVIALTRTCDYHHHWQDVVVGSVLGVGVSWLCYFQYYPPLGHVSCAVPYSAIPLLRETIPETEQLRKTDSLEDITVKWI